MKNFTNNERALGLESAITETWFSFRNSLANKEYSYDEINKAKSSDFLRVFDSLFENCGYLFSTTLGELSNKNISFCRGANIYTNELISYERFIPKIEYLTEARRFSPPGIEWLYLAVGRKNAIDSGLPEAEWCAIKECRATQGHQFALCSFKIAPSHLDVPIVDLTISRRRSYSEINIELDKMAASIAENELALLFPSAFPCHPQKNPKDNLFAWISMMYSKLLSEQIFCPVESDDKDVLYAPFHCMAQYFASKGYKGILYSSTVYPSAQNIVIFDKTMARPFGEIKVLTVPPYIK